MYMRHFCISANLSYRVICYFQARWPTWSLWASVKTIWSRLCLAYPCLQDTQSNSYRAVWWWSAKIWKYDFHWPFLHILLGSTPSSNPYWSWRCRWFFAFLLLGPARVSISLSHTVGIFSLRSSWRVSLWWIWWFGCHISWAEPLSCRSSY